MASTHHISLLVNSWGRDELAAKTLGAVLRNHGYDGWLCVFMNFQGVPAPLTRKELQETGVPWIDVSTEKNIGVACGNNLLLGAALRQCASDYYCILDNDILLPDGWLDRFHATAEAISNLRFMHPGISGIHTVEKLPAVKDFDGIKIHPAVIKYLADRNAVFGTKFFSATLLNTIGYFREDWSGYGLEDADYSFRSSRAGFLNYYLHDLHGNHVAHPYGEHDTGEYRAFKDAELKRASAMVDRGIVALNAQYAKSLYVDSAFAKSEISSGNSPPVQESVR